MSYNYWFFCHLQNLIMSLKTGLDMITYIPSTNASSKCLPDTTYRMPIQITNILCV